MNKVPFTVYDVFAYLSSGGIVVISIDLLYGAGISQSKTSLMNILILIFSAYIAGHVVAHISSALLETLVVWRFLGRSVDILMAKEKRRLRWIFPQYFRALPEQTQNRIRARARERGFTGSGEALFLHALGATKEIKRTQDRLDQFRNLYGFSRNVCLALLLLAVLLLVGPLDQRDAPDKLWALLAGASATVLFYRYLKFLRHYSYELLTSFAELKSEKG